MSERTTRLVVLNQKTVPLNAIVELWGEEFTLGPGEEAEIIAISNDECQPWIHFVSKDD